MTRVWGGEWQRPTLPDGSTQHQVASEAGAVKTLAGATAIGAMHAFTHQRQIDARCPADVLLLGLGWPAG